MKLEAGSLKILKKVDDTQPCRKTQQKDNKKAIAKPKAKKESKKTLKMLPGQVPAILFSKFSASSQISSRLRRKPLILSVWRKIQ